MGRVDHSEMLEASAEFNRSGWGRLRRQSNFLCPVCSHGVSEFSARCPHCGLNLMHTEVIRQQVRLKRDIGPRVRGERSAPLIVGCKIAGVVILLGVVLAIFSAGLTAALAATVLLGAIVGFVATLRLDVLKICIPLVGSAVVLIVVASVSLQLHGQPH